MELDQAEEAEFVAATLADFVAAVRARESGTDSQGNLTFTTSSPDWWAGGRTFGGMVVAQALSAGMRTRPARMELHSLHGYFVRPTPLGAQTTHVVTNLRDGRSFSTREVVSTVDGKDVFRMTCSFHAPEEGAEYQLPMATDVPDPQDVEGVESPFFFDVRELGHTEPRADGTYLSTRRVWFRTRERLDDDPETHACVLTYFSDMTGASFRPLSLGSWGTHTDASLDHAVWFHRTARADEWSMYDLQALVNAGGRATVRATMHDAAGRLHLSMAQELLIRELDEPLVFKAPPWVDRRDEKEGQTDGAA